MCLQALYFARTPRVKIHIRVYNDVERNYYLRHETGPRACSDSENITRPITRPLPTKYNAKRDTFPDRGSKLRSQFPSSPRPYAPCTSLLKQA